MNSALSDLKRLESYDPSVRQRASVEMTIVRFLLSHLIANGKTLSVWDGGGRSVKNSTDVEALMDAIFAVDESTIITPDGSEIVIIILGNDGWDVVADYSSSLEELMKPVNEFAESFDAG